MTKTIENEKVEKGRAKQKSIIKKIFKKKLPWSNSAKRQSGIFKENSHLRILET